MEEPALVCLLLEVYQQLHLLLQQQQRVLSLDGVSPVNGDPGQAGAPATSASGTIFVFLKKISNLYIVCPPCQVALPWRL